MLVLGAVIVFKFGLSKTFEDLKKTPRFKFPKKLINKINEEIDKITSNKLLANRLDYSKKLRGVNCAQRSIKMGISTINEKKLSRCVRRPL